ncbi:hypothetical protein FGO68_gene2705 [Halteria grandinella]|uniref:Uncharacterized protein n=1 Tax=Halteria grandinella TaxID=5974 RepID=A0A8J8NG45_HALGN|nr:hypothetical protein FGO68_gene2705 [Halteria grandinella]
MEDLLSFLRPMSNTLLDCDLRLNPVTKSPKYRDQVILVCIHLEMLDDKKVLEQERKYLFNLFHQREIQHASKHLLGIKPVMQEYILSPKVSQSKLGTQRYQAKPPQLEQQINVNHFGATKRGYKGTMLKAQKIGSYTNRSRVSIQQVGLSVMGSPMATNAASYMGIMDSYQLHNPEQQFITPSMKSKILSPMSMKGHIDPQGIEQFTKQYVLSHQNTTDSNQIHY